MRRLSWLFVLAFLACGGSEGPAGPPGPQGPPGAAGTNGTNGATGANGANGTSADGGLASATCVPNGQIACQCASGGTGFQTCAADGLSYGVCTCPDGGALGDSGDGGGTFSIATMPGLVAWFKGDKGIVDDLAHAGHVKRWLDQSGNGNDAQQRSSTDGPTHDPAAVNGIDAVYFDFQTGLDILDSSTLKIGTDDFAIVFVAKIQPGNTNVTTFLFKDSLAITIGTGQGTLDVNAGGATASIGFPSASKWQVFSVRGKTLKLAIDDSTATTSSTSTTDLTSGAAAWTILPQTTGTLATAELVELLIVKGAVSDADLAKVQASLKTKYNL